MPGEFLTIQILAVGVTVVAKVFGGYSLWWLIPNFILLFLAWNAYRMLIYERYLNPVSKLPGPSGHWLWGQFPAINHAEPGAPHVKWLREYRSPVGLVAYPGLFYSLRVMPTSTSTVQHVLNNTSIYVKPAQAVRSLKMILGDGLLTAEGEMHKRQRKVLNPAFATSYIRDNVPVFSEKALGLANTLLDEIKSQPAEGIEVFKFLSRATLDIIGSAGFGYEFNSLYNPDDPFASAYASLFQRQGSRLLQVVSNYIPLMRHLPVPRVLAVKRARKTIKDNATKLVRDKEAQPTLVGKDILSLMIAENRKAEGKLAEMELVDQVMTFLAAGHETTSTAVAWTLYTLSQHQDVQKRLREEIRNIENPTFENIEACRYLNNVCREMLRFIPPVSLTTRTTSQADVISGVTIPKGTLLFVPILALNFDDAVWGPDVDSFNPDRWEKLPETVSNYNYLTFLQGPRSCIGRKFAEVEMKVLLVALIQRIQFDEVVKGRIIEKTSVITTRPKGGMWLKLSAV